MPDPFSLAANRQIIDPFSASAGGFDPFANGPGLGMFDVTPGSEGIFGTLIGLPVAIVRELARDVAGAGRVAGATVGELASLAFDNVPFTWEQLESRDIQGALSIGALAAGGVLGAAASKTPLLAGLAGRGAVGRMGATASAEFVAGGAFGLIRPLEAGEDRFDAIRDEAIFGAAVGAGASAVKSAIRSTIGGRVAAIRNAQARTTVAQAAKGLDQELLAQDLAGVSLRDEANGRLARIARVSPTKVRLTELSTDGGLKTVGQPRDFATMGEALHAAKKGGFIEEGITARTARNFIPEGQAKNVLDESYLAGLTRDDQGRLISSAIGDIKLAEFTAVREAGLMLKESGDEMAFVMAEAVAPSGTYGPFAFPTPGARDRWLAELSHVIPPSSAVGLSDGQVLKEAIKEGIVDVENITAAGNVDQFLRELTLNERVPQGFTTVLRTPHEDALLLRVLTPKTLGKLYPKIAPLVDEATARIRVRDKRKLITNSKLDDLARRVTKEEADRAVSMIDDVAREFADLIDATPSGELDMSALVAAADAEILSRAQALGGGAQTFAEEAVEILSGYRKELTEIGRLSEGGIAAYFPIVNANQWKLTVPAREGLESFQGFWSTKEEALAKLDELQTAFPDLPSASITPNRFMMEFDDVVTMDPRQHAAMIKAVKEAASEEYELSTSAAAEIAKDVGIAVRRRRVAKQGAGFLRRRELGSRAFSRDAFDALRSYANMADNLIAMEAAPEALLAKLDDPAAALSASSFRQNSEQIIRALPGPDPFREGGAARNATALQEWAMQYVDDMTGRPRAAERAVDSLLQHLGIDAKPRALRRLSGAIRKWQGFSRLGGFTSGIVNLTQIPINTMRVLSIQDTLKGMEALTSLGKWREITTSMTALGVIDDAFIPLSADALESVATWDGSIKQALKDKKFGDALFRMHLFAFNGAEKVNRVVTGWGAFNKALKENGGNRAAAAAAAKEVVNRTQFDYALSNMPQFLRGPVGSVLFQFKSFVINELEFMATLTPKQLTGMATTFAAVGGLAAVVNIPGGDLVNLASSWAFGEKMDDAIERRVGNDSHPLAKLGAYGLPGMLVNVDLSDYVGTGNLADITRGLFGPTASDLGSLRQFVVEGAKDFKAFGGVSKETRERFIQRALPSSVRRFQRGMDIAQTGEVRHPYSGKLVYQPGNRAASAARAVIGIPELNQSREMAMNRVTEAVRDRYQRGAAAYAKAIAEATERGRVAEAGRLRGQARSEGFEVTDRQIRYYLRTRAWDGAERRRRRLPAATREEWSELFEATGGWEL